MSTNLMLFLHGYGGVALSTVNGVTIRGAGGRILNGAGTGQSIIRQNVNNYEVTYPGVVQ